MSLILRRTKKTIWSGGEVDEERRRAAVADLARSEADSDGLSVFEIVDENERQLVIAAIACSRGDDGPIDLLELTREDIERYGTIDPSDGTTPVASANRLHRALDWTATQLEQLAVELLARGETARRYSRSSVRAAVQTLDPTLIEDEQARALVERLQTRRS